MTETERPEDTSNSVKDAGRNSDGKADERKTSSSVAQVSRNREWEEQERRIREQKLGLHPLQHRYVVWHTRRGRQQQQARTTATYEDNIRRVSEFTTVESFWTCYCRLTRPPDLPVSTDINIFRDGIRPLWEDPANRNGGKWTIRIRKPLTSRKWEDLILAFIGEQLDGSDSEVAGVGVIAGVGLSVRFNEDIISVWDRPCSDAVKERVLESIRKHLQLPPTYTVEYKLHDMSLKDHTAFRNAAWHKAQQQPQQQQQGLTEGPQKKEGFEENE